MARRLVTGVMALSALAGLVASGVVGASVASATSNPACTATSTATCTLTLKMASGTWATQGGTPPNKFPSSTTAGFTGTENPKGGGFTGTLTFPTTTFNTTGAISIASYYETTAGSAIGQVKATGKVTITDALTLEWHITSPVTYQCISDPVTVKFQSTAPYNPATGGSVTLKASTFTIPKFSAKPGAGCTSIAQGTLDARVGGSKGNEITTTVKGVLVVPSVPTRTSVTTLTASPSGRNIAGQSTTLTATVSPSTASGSVAFFTGTTQLATVVLSSASAQYKTSSLAAGTHHLKVVYSGNGTFKTSTGALTYVISAVPVVTVNYPTSVVQGAASPTKFAGVISDPAGGPTVPNARLDFKITGVTTLTSGDLTLAVCTTASYVAPSCTTNILTGTTTLTGEYGGTTGFPLTPGQQIPLYFELSSPSGARFGTLKVTTSLVSVTSAGTSILATLTSSTTPVNLTLGAPQATTLTATARGAGGTKTYQGFGVKVRGDLAYSSSEGPTPTGSLSITTTTTVAGTKKQATLGAFPVETTSPTVTLNTATWPVGPTEITLHYSGNTFYLPSTSAPVTFTVVTPPAGAKYVCKLTALGGLIKQTGLGAIMTSVSTVHLPATALPGTTVPVSFAAHLKFDSLTILATNISSSVSSFSTKFGLSPSGTASTVLPTGHPVLRNPEGVAVDTTTHDVYVTSAAGVVGELTPSTKTVLAEITVGQSPTGIAFDPTNGDLYVVNKTSGTVSVITTTANSVVATLTVGKGPYDAAVDPATHQVFVTNHGATSVSVITADTNAVVGSPIAVGSKPWGVAVDPTTSTVYVVNHRGTSVSLVTATSHAASGTIAVGRAPEGIAVDPTTDTAYVTNTTTTSVSVITGATKDVSSGLSLERVSTGIAVDPAAGYVYVGSRDATGAELHVITVKKAAIVGTPVTTGAGPAGVAVDTSSGTVYALGSTSATVSILSGGNQPAMTGTITLSGSKASFTRIKTPMTLTVTFMEGGTVTAPTSPGPVPVQVTSYKYSTGVASWTCVANTTPATVATVQVLAPAKPTVTTQPASQTANAGTAATFTATASGEPAPSVQWQSSTNGGSTWTTIAGATTGKQSTQTTTATYTTPSTTAAANGTDYRAVFTNTSGSVDSSAATLTVNVAPTVTTQPTSAAVTAGTPVSFTAGATARPAASVQWQVSTNGGKTFTNVAGATSTTLTFAPTKSQGTNQYRAVFTNDLGSATTKAATLTVATTGYRLFGSDGAVYDFGTAPFYGSMGGQALNAPVVGAADTPTGKGYWEVAKDGGIFAFGTAGFYGSMGGQPLNQPVVGMAATPTGKGYWEVAKDGGIFAFGAAQFYGSMGGQPLNQPIVGMAAAPTGKGYWLVASDGGIFAFGSAQFYGSTGSLTLAQPITAMAAAPTGKGYWLVAKDGGVFSFGSAPFEGSAAGGSAGPYLSMAAAPTGKGYWLAGAFGAVTAFGTAPLAGSMAGQPLNAPVVAITAG